MSIWTPGSGERVSPLNDVFDLQLIGGILLAGILTLERLGQTWASVWGLEFAPYSEIRRLFGFRLLICSLTRPLGPDVS